MGQRTAPGDGFLLAAPHNIQPIEPSDNIVSMFDKAPILLAHPLNQREGVGREFRTLRGYARL